MTETGAERIAAKFDALRTANRKALVAYVTAGHPTIDDSNRLLQGLVDAGVDIIELGVPFSDPLADGPVIQRSTARAIANGMTLRGTLDIVHAAKLTVPVVLFGYLNPFLAAGADVFERARDAGCAGVLITDLPAAADPDVEGRVADSGLALIRLVAPTTKGSRMRDVVQHASGFIYVVSRLGVTGTQDSLSVDLDETVARARAVTTLPICVGFGVSTPDHARSVARVADGVVVGSAIVRAAEESVDHALQLIRDLRAAIDES